MGKPQVILLPGVVLPAAVGFRDLTGTLGDEVEIAPKELEVYATDPPPDDYTLDREVEGILGEAERLDAETFHLAGYSGGGAAALAFCAKHPERLRSVTLMEPAWAGREGLSEPEEQLWRQYDEIAALPFEQMMSRFVGAQLAPGVDPPPPPPGPPPPWMATRPAAIRALTGTFNSYDLDFDALRSFQRPVLYLLGGKSNPVQFELMARRLETVFADFTLEVFEERHHFDPPHRREPERTAEILLRFWNRADAA